MEERETKSIARKSAIKPSSEEDVKIPAQTFCAMKGYSTGVAVRLGALLDQKGDAERDKTISEWEGLYSEAMNRVTQ